MLELDPNNLLDSDGSEEAAVYQIKCFPTLVIECNGEACLCLEGYKSKATIEEHIEQLSSGHELRCYH